MWNSRQDTVAVRESYFKSKLSIDKIISDLNKREKDAADEPYPEEPETPPPSHLPPVLAAQDSFSRSIQKSPSQEWERPLLSNTKIFGIVISCLVVILALLFVILCGRNYQGIINSLLQPLSELRPYIILLTDTATTISTKQISDIIFKMNPKFIVFIVFITFLAVCVPLAGISLCICKTCDKFDNLHFPSRSVLGWKVFYSTILIILIGIVAERIVTCSIATTLLQSSFKGILPQAETLVHESTEYIENLNYTMQNLPSKLASKLTEYEEEMNKLKEDFDLETQSITNKTTSNLLIFKGDFSEVLVNGSAKVLVMENEIQNTVSNIFRNG